MTEGLAIEVACAKMREQNVGKNYLVRYRHFQLQPGKQITLKVQSDLLILLTPDIETRVLSKSGIFDLKDSGVLEMQYLHTGTVTVENLSVKNPIQVKFLQVIPLNQHP